jgi:hypothetical protein
MLGKRYEGRGNAVKEKVSKGLRHEDAPFRKRRPAVIAVQVHYLIKALPCYGSFV